MTYPDEHGVLVDFEKFNRFNCVHVPPDEKDELASGTGDVSPRVFDVSWNGERAPTILPVLDDKDLGMSVISAICNVIYFNEKKAGVEPIERSRLFAYYNERVHQGKLYEDIECNVSHCVQTINKIGLCPESRLPYNPLRMTEKPSDVCYEMARNQRPLVYKRVQTKIHEIKAVLAENRLVIASVRVHNDNAGEPVLDTHTSYKPTPAGIPHGHCVVVYGWDDDRRLFKFLNSWGSDWGNAGCGTIQYECLTKPDTDLWVLE